MYAKRGNLDGGIADFSRAIQVDPKNAQAYYYREFLCQSQGQPYQANADFNEARELGLEVN